MKVSIVLLLVYVLCQAASAQLSNTTDSLRNIIAQNKQDSRELQALTALAQQINNVDSFRTYLQRGILLSKKLEDKIGQADLLIIKLVALYRNDISEAINDGLKALE